MLDRLFPSRSTPHLLFVCTANLCRSPLAEGLCRSLTENLGWKISSAGFFVDDPTPPVPEVLAILHAHGLDTSQFKRNPMEKRLVGRASHIFVMTEMHLSTLWRQFPRTKTCSYLITAFSTLPEYRNQDVPDPMGNDVEAFEETYHIFEDALPRLIKFVKRTSQR